jgi:hypothetical protein
MGAHSGIINHGKDIKLEGKIDWSLRKIIVLEKRNYG